MKDQTLISFTVFNIRDGDLDPKKEVSTSKQLTLQVVEKKP